MEQYIIKGGHPLVGEVEIGGAKNAALAILAAAIMTDETVLIDNLPDVNDINVLIDAISTLMSFTSGKLSINTVSSVMIAAARIASAAFFAPPISTSPTSG